MVLGEVESIVSYYLQSSGSKLAAGFADEFLQRVSGAAERPWIYAIQKKGLRRVNLRRFPYNFLFLVDDAEVLVTAVRHNSRHPSYGVGRR